MIPSKLDLLEFFCYNLLVEQRSRFYHYIVRRYPPRLEIITADIPYKTIDIENNLLFQGEEIVINISIIYNHIR